MILFMDALYATQGVMETCLNNNWEFMITLPATKLKNLAKVLNKNKETSQPIPGQHNYRERYQEFYWENNICYGVGYDLSINIVGCSEKYYIVNQ